MNFDPRDIPGGGRIDLDRPFKPLSIAILTVSDTRDASNDTSGDLLASRVARDGHSVAARAIVRDDKAVIQAQLHTWIGDPKVHVVVSTGGTGLSGRDITPESMRPLFDKEIDGFSTLFHLVSFQTVGVSTMQSRACAGIAQGTILFALPGSNGACKDGWDLLIRWQLDARHRPCNLVELLPRFQER
jgi:molybdenum cofactor biosynthesis protein B